VDDLRSPAGWLPVHRDQLRAQRSVSSMGSLYLYLLPLFNATKFGWRPLLECRAVTLPRRETRWNLQGCPKLTNRSQPLVCRTSPYYQDMRRRYCWLTNVFPIVDTWLSSEDIARQICAMVPKWRFFAPCILRRAACSTFQTCILNSH